MSRDDWHQEIGRLEGQLAGFSPSLVADFRRALKEMSSRLSAGELRQWADEGRDLAQQAWRAWEAASEYFLASSQVLELVGEEGLWAWVRHGKELAALSSALAAAYFRASGATLRLIGLEGLGKWVTLGRHLYKGSWRSAALAVQFFEQSPVLFTHLPLEEVGVLVRFLDILCDRSFDLATHCLGVAPHVLQALDGEDRLAFLEFAEALASIGWADARAYLERGPQHLARLHPSQRKRFLELARHVIHQEGRQAFSYFVEACRSLGSVEPSLHAHLLSLGERLLPYSPVACMEFLRNVPRLLIHMKMEELEQWHAEGQTLLATNVEGGEAFFRLESSRAEEVMEGLSSRLELKKVSSVLRMYCRALTGTDVEIRPADVLVSKGIGWINAESPTTEGTAIFLPSAIQEFPNKEGNFSAYKVYATHQAGHLEFGSFALQFDKPAHYFPSLRGEREQQRQQQASSGPQRPPLTDMERFFDLFEHRRLATDIFTVLEDARIDSRILYEYAGIRSEYRAMQRRELEKRPPIDEMPLLQAFMENLVRFSLGGEDHILWPRPLKPIMDQALAIMATVQQPDTTVEDVAEATIRLYDLATSLPNILMTEWEQWERQEGEQMNVSLSASPGQGEQLEGLEGEEQPYESPQPVDFRGQFKPELVQLLAKLREERRGPGQPSPIDPQRLQDLLKKSVEIELKDGGEADLQHSTQLFVTSLEKELSRQEKEAQEARRERRRTTGLSTPEQDEHPLTPEPRYYYYDEWDFRANDYKPRWCRIVEYIVAEGTLAYYEQTLAKHSSLLRQTQRQFEMLRPELLRKMKRLLDGEELDMDAVVDYLVEREAGASPQGKVYWRRNKMERDVAVAFLLDMSASTDEEIIKHPRRHLQDDFDDDPRRYFSWWVSRRAQELMAPPKRIIDVEKESIVLLIGALETIGDKYGIYGFSGYGRENVEFYVIKELWEPLTDKVKRRIDKIAPVRSTRMGPAVRHAVHKMEQVDSKVRILFLISDGRPQDHGYGRDRTEREYAIHDTHMALLEAKRKGIVPFCLTVDRYGHDYLKEMCQDIGYVVVPDVDSLPSRITQLYRELTR